MIRIQVVRLLRWTLSILETEKNDSKIGISLQPAEIKMPQSVQPIATFPSATGDTGWRGGYWGNSGPGGGQYL